MSLYRYSSTTCCVCECVRACACLPAYPHLSICAFVCVCVCVCAQVHACVCTWKRASCQSARLKIERDRQRAEPSRGTEAFNSEVGGQLHSN